MNRIATTAAATIVGGFALLALTACQSGFAGPGVSHQASALAGQLASVGGQAAGAASAARSAVPVADAAPKKDASANPGASSGDAAGSLAPGAGSAHAPSNGGSSGGSTGTSGSSRPATGPDSGGTEGTGQQGTGQQSTLVSIRPKTTTSTAVQPAPYFVFTSIGCDFSESDHTYHENLSYQVANATGMALSIDDPGSVGSFGTYDWHGTVDVPNLGCYSVNGPQTYTLSTVGGLSPQVCRTIIRTGTQTAITPPPFSHTTATAVPTPKSTSATTAQPTHAPTALVTRTPVADANDAPRTLVTAPLTEPTPAPTALLTPSSASAPTSGS